MTDDEKLGIGLSLLRRCGGVILDRADGIAHASHRADGKSILETKLDSVTSLLKLVEEIVDERGPDVLWFRDLHRFEGTHAVLTEEGWVPAEYNTREVTGEDPMEVFDEVNAPAGNSEEEPVSS